MESNVNKWSLGQKVRLSWKAKLLKKSRKKSYERMIGSDYICIREASDEQNGILLRVLDNAKASSMMVVCGEPFFKDDYRGLFEGSSYSSYSFPTLAELKEVLAILHSNPSLLTCLESASMMVNLQSYFWVNETASTFLFMKQPLCYNPSSDSLCIASGSVSPCRLTMVYFNTQMQLVDFVTGLSDVEGGEAGKLIQQNSDVACKKWILPAILSLGVVFYGGYLTGKYSNNQEEQLAAPVEKAVATDKVATDKALAKGNVPEAKTPVKEEAPKAKEPVKEDISEKKAPVKENVPETKAPVKESVAPSQQKESGELDQYEEKDIRIRTGAYRIVGLDHVVKVKANDNLTRIAKRTIGPGMECYIEAYNGITSKTPLKAGQTIKIPKLERKKKKPIAP